MENPELICDIINEENSDGNSEGSTVVLEEGVTLVCFDITMIGLSDFINLEKRLVLIGLKYNIKYGDKI